MSANEVSHLAEEYGLGPLQGIRMTLLKGAARPTGNPIKGNPARFPPDFMFQFNNSEKQEVVTNCDHFARPKYSPDLPYAFTEHGALMLGNVPRFDSAVEVSLHVLRIFAGLYGMLSSHKELAVKHATLERKVGIHDQAIAGLIDAIRQLMAEPKEKIRPIGFVLTEHPPGHEDKNNPSTRANHAHHKNQPPHP